MSNYTSVPLLRLVALPAWHESSILLNQAQSPVQPGAALGAAQRCHGWDLLNKPVGAETKATDNGDFKCGMKDCLAT